MAQATIALREFWASLRWYPQNMWYYDGGIVWTVDGSRFVGKPYYGLFLQALIEMKVLDLSEWNTFLHRMKEKHGLTFQLTVPYLDLIEEYFVHMFSTVMSESDDELAGDWHPEKKRQLLSFRKVIPNTVSRFKRWVAWVRHYDLRTKHPNDKIWELIDIIFWWFNTFDTKSKKIFADDPLNPRLRELMYTPSAPYIPPGYSKGQLKGPSLQALYKIEKELGREQGRDLRSLMLTERYPFNVPDDVLGVIGSFLTGERGHLPMQREKIRARK